MKNAINLMSRIILIFVIALMPQITMAVSLNDKTRINLDTTQYDESDLANSTCTSQGAEELDGHKLPATKGGAGLEEPINEAGQVPSTGNTVTFAKFAKLGQDYRDYYINMRWRYVKWRWSDNDGPIAVSPGPEKVDWYAEKPRRVLVTNPRTKKSIIAVALEAGPAPWTGVDNPETTVPKQGWVNPQDGTPPQYKGRVSGFPPKAFSYLGIAQRMVDGSGDDLLYSWAPDQNAKPGPVTTTASSGTKKTVVIGDSISVGMRDEGDLKQKLSSAGWKSTIDPSGSRSIAGAGNTDRKTSGLRAVQDNKDEIKDANVVAIQLGTNASPSLNDFKSDVKEMVKDIKQINNSATILWVNLFSKVSHQESYNNALTQLGQSEDFKILDVSQVSLDFASDNVHLTPNGYKKLSEKVTEGINGSSSGDANCDEIGDAKIIQLKPRLATTGKIRPTAVILHWWGYNAEGNSGIQSLVNGLRGNPDCGAGGCSVQLGILRDGKTYQLTNSLTSRALHATCANNFGIGIEIEGKPSDFGASGPEKRPEQFKAVVSTVKYLMDKYNIPLEASLPKGVHSHKEADKYCNSGYGKDDVDDAYLEKVKQALRSGNAN